MRDQGPHGPGTPPPPGEGWERPPAPVTRGRFGEPRPPRTNGHSRPLGHQGHPMPFDGRTVPQPAVPRYAAGADAWDDLDGLEDDGPIDLVELQADDELINALSSGLGVSGPGRRGYDVDDHLAAMLSSWKDEVDRAPVPQLVDVDEAVQILQPATPSRKVSFLRPLIAAAAVAACALAVVSISAHEAQPGDALWGVSRVLYSERADQVQAATTLREGIERVNAKLAAGDTAGAQQELAALGPLVDRTAPDLRDDFEQQNRFLSQKVAETPPGTPTDPRSPLRDGTPAPPPPVSEGDEDTPTREPRPSERPTSPESSTSPERTPGDPSVLRGPGESSPTTTPPSPSETSPTTEGQADPTTPTPTPSTRPTAAGEGQSDPSDETDPPSSTTTGAVSSTPN
ncbi:anti-sigma-D factor RsdA [Pseudonocardia sp. ICBG1293]|uniref:anti-sigma-D factor RsdA n=1 Tax=Pseudonocardia sp. ICBG1293 TaxID=2844382 RepID=UPI001CCA7D3E|nr:anti-sigma-D factor RsdA [Pseudonocardia sp. ICBG1293]